MPQLVIGRVHGFPPEYHWVNTSWPLRTATNSTKDNQVGKILLDLAMRYIQEHPEDVQRLVSAAVETFTAYLKTLPATFEVKP